MSGPKGKESQNSEQDPLFNLSEVLFDETIGLRKNGKRIPRHRPPPTSGEIIARKEVRGMPELRVRLPDGEIEIREDTNV